MNRLLISVAAAALVAGAPAVAAEISVPMDQVKMVTFKTPVATVFVGNPSIADVTVIDTTHVFVLGKSFGNTNVIGLDAEGKQAINEQIAVMPANNGVVTVHRGKTQVTMTCSMGRCLATPMPGDDPTTFDAVTSQSDKRQEAGLRAAAQNTPQ